LKKSFHPEVFFEKWNDTQKPKKNLRKESWQRTSCTTKWDKLGQVGVVGQVGQGEEGLQILVGQVEQGERGLQIFVGQVGQGQGARVCPLEPFHLSQMGLQGRGNVSKTQRIKHFGFHPRDIHPRLVGGNTSSHLHKVLSV